MGGLTLAPSAVCANCRDVSRPAGLLRGDPMCRRRVIGSFPQSALDEPLGLAIGFRSVGSGADVPLSTQWCQSGILMHVHSIPPNKGVAC